MHALVPRWCWLLVCASRALQAEAADGRCLAAWQRTWLPLSVGCVLMSAWSAQSQMKPPMSRPPGDASKQAQYSARLPVLLPMEWAYSHSMTGRWSPLPAAAAASCVSCGMRAYMGQIRSVAGVREPPPCRQQQRERRTCMLGGSRRA